MIDEKEEIYVLTFVSNREQKLYEKEVVEQEGLLFVCDTRIIAENIEKKN